MRQEHDTTNDVMRIIYNDKPIASSVEHDVLGGRHVMHHDSEGTLVAAEIHGYAKFLERAASTQRTESRPDPGSDMIIGHLNWTIVDESTKKVLHEGRTDLNLRDITIEEVRSPGSVLHSKTFPLAGPFILGLSGGQSESAEGGGFALSGNRSDSPGDFSWDWFEVTAPGVAKKLQEAGRLIVRFEKRGDAYDLVYTEFLTDVSVRIQAFDLRPRDPRKPDWRINIASGSVVTWPSLVDGRVVAN